MILGVLGCLAASRPLDLLTLGDDTASVLGLQVRRTRLAVVVPAVLLTACSIAVAGPTGFVGLAAPALVRLVGSDITQGHRHRVLLPLGGLAGVLVVLGADVLQRVLLGAQGGVKVPTGVVTSIFGAVVLVWVASRHRA